MLRNIVACILAGGQGTRLWPLTANRAKPAVRFGGSYRLIDFPLSNCVNSTIRQILVFPQYKARSVDWLQRLGMPPVQGLYGSAGRDPPGSHRAAPISRSGSHTNAMLQGLMCAIGGRERENRARFITERYGVIWLERF